MNGDKVNWTHFRAVTKFRLSQLSTMGSFAMYLVHVPTLNVLDCCLFLTATQAVTMSSQAFN